MTDDDVTDGRIAGEVAPVVGNLSGLGANLSSCGCWQKPDPDQLAVTKK